jgi:TRAP transporter TAXI family solute receptor
MKKLSRLLGLLMALSMVLALAACSPAASTPTATPAPAPATAEPNNGGGDAAPAPTPRTAPSSPTVVRIASGPLSSQQNTTYNGIVDLINKDLPGFYNFAIEGSTGSAENARLLAAGEVDFGTMGLDVSLQVFNGTGDFEGMQGDIRQVLTHPGTGAIVHVIVPTNSDINTIEDLAGKKVAATAGVMQGYLEDVLFAHDMTTDDLGSLVNLSLSDMITALQDGTIDVLCYGNIAPNTNFTDLATTFGFKLIDIGEEAVAKLIEAKPWYHPETIAAGTYKGCDEDIHSFAQATVLCCSASLPDEVVYDFVSTVVNRAEDVAAVNAGWKGLTAETCTAYAVIPYHSGAAQFYAEQNLTVETN